VAIEEEFRSGNPDVAGLFMGWADWQMEILLIQEEIGQPGRKKPLAAKPAASGGEVRGD
jgi:hypothetical protein